MHLSVLLSESRYLANVHNTLEVMYFHLVIFFQKRSVFLSEDGENMPEE